MSEVDEGAVKAFRLDDGLSAAGQVSTGGSQPCHVAVSPDGRHVVCANYASGSVAVFATGPDGDLDCRTDLVQHTGFGPHAGRQEGPHAHHVTVLDGAVSVVDLGSDTIVHYGLSSAGLLQQHDLTRSPAGSGPRHLVTHPSGRHFVVDELTSTVSTYDASFQLVGSQPATLVAPDGDNLPSELVLSPDASFLYVANRGNDSIATFSVGDAGLTPVDEIACGGAWPRHIAIVAGSLLVANQHSDNVTAFRLDPTSGAPRGCVVAAEIPAPACILPVVRPSAGFTAHLARPR